MIVRGCGKRVRTGIYVESRRVTGGSPVEEFVLDPPIPINLADFGLTPRGVKLVEWNGVYHIFDVVGKKDYKVADFIEEVRMAGASRRLSPTLDFSLLSPDSRLYLIHEQAIITNFGDYPQPPTVICPVDKHYVPLTNEMCAGLFWHDFSPKDLRKTEIGFLRDMPGGFSYAAHLRPDGVRPQYGGYGIFMSLPITNLTVIRGETPEEQEVVERRVKAAQKAGVPVYLEDE